VKCNFKKVNGSFAFLSPLPLWGLEATYYVHLRLVGKRVVEFLLVIIKLFRCYGWYATIEYRLKIGVLLERRQFGSKFQVPTILHVEKQDKLALIWYKNVNTSFSRFVTMHTFDRRTDGRTDRRTERPSQYCVLCILSCSRMIKTKLSGMSLT